MTHHEGNGEAVPREKRPTDFPEQGRSPGGPLGGKPNGRPTGKAKRGSGHLVVSVHGEEWAYPPPQAISAALHAVGGMPATPLTVAAVRAKFPEPLVVGENVTIRSRVAAGAVEDEVDEPA